MNMPTRQFQNQVGGQTVVCQSDTLVIQPFVTSSASFTKPYQDFYLDPIYSVKDTEGATDANGVTIGDGDPDNWLPGLSALDSTTNLIEDLDDDDDGADDTKA